MERTPQVRGTPHRPAPVRPGIFYPDAGDPFGYQVFDAAQPGWRSLTAGNFPWVLPVYAALAATGDRYPTLRWPWYIAESAWVLEARALTDRNKGGGTISFAIRPVAVPDDYPRIAEILTLTTDTPSTPERLVANDATLPASTIRHRLTAVTPEGVIAAYGIASHGSWSLPGRYHVRVFTHPDCRRRGAGSQLWDALVGFARANGATSLATSAQDDDPAGIAFVEKRGFTKVRHIFESQTDLTQHDGSAYAHVVAGLEAAGIRFFTLADQPGEATERALYALDTVVAWDNPGDEIGEFPAFEVWRPMMLGRQGQRPEFIGIAADGDRVVGFTTMYTTTIPGLFDIGFTGVDREYRGRGLALALKVRAAQVARQFGATALRTGNDSRNAPMLAVNQKLGYQRLPGRFEYERALTASEN